MKEKAKGDQKMGQVGKRLWKDIKGFAPVAVLFLIYYLVSHRLYDAFCPLLIVTGIPGSLTVE